MSRNITLTDSEIDTLVKTYREQIANIDVLLKPMQEKVNLLLTQRVNAENRLKEIEGEYVPERNYSFDTESIQERGFTPYDAKWKNPKKVDYIFERHPNAELSTREMFNWLVKQEADLKNKEKSLIEALSTITTAGLGKGKFYVATTKDDNGKRRFGLVKK